MTRASVAAETTGLEVPRDAGADAREEEQGSSFDEFLPEPVEIEAPRPAEEPRRAPLPPAPGLRSARLLGLEGRTGEVLWRGSSEAIFAEVAPEVDRELIASALAQGDWVLVECVEGEAPVIVGVLQTRLPREIRLKAATVHIEGEQEVLLRSGRGAVRIREDGDIEIVGSRISAASRGLFRLVGRILRLN